MKKSLLATTALAALGAVAFAGSASAAEKIKIGVGGYMEQWFAYADSKNSVQPQNKGFDQQSDDEIFFKGETTLDNGLTIGVNVQLEAQTSGDQIDEQYLYVEGTFGRVIMGSENSASYLMHYGIPSMGAGLDSGDATQYIAGTDFSGARTNGRGIDNDNEKVTYFTPRFQGFQLGASYVPQMNQDADTVSGVDAPNDQDAVRDDSFAIAANFKRSFNDVSLAASAGYQDMGDAPGVGDLESWQLGLQIGFAGFKVAGTYGEEDRAVNSTQETIGVGVSYTSGPFGVSLAYIGSDRENTAEEQDAFELGAKYALGPGIDAKGSIYYVERDNAAGTEVANGFAVVGGLALGF